MRIKKLDPNNLSKDEDWEGNNASFICPHCKKVFIVSGFYNKGVRSCPNCGKSTGKCKGGKKSGGTASLEWLDENSYTKKP